MKRLYFLLLILTVSVGMIQAGGTKTCRVCGGLGHVPGRSDIICSGCSGTGRQALSPYEQRKEQKENDDYAKSANDMMNAYNLTPEEYFAYEELVKQAMTQVPVYQNCTVCNATGKCKQCGGYMNVSLDGPLCMVCSGSGICISCQGSGKHLLGYQDNPNKAQLIARAKEILNHGSQKRQVNNPGSLTSGTNNGTNVSSNLLGDDDDFDLDDKKGTSFLDILGIVLGVGIIGWIGIKIFK